MTSLIFVDIGWGNCLLPQAPVPLTVFRSNLKFNKNFEYSGLKYAQPITTNFCTCHDSYTVVTCAKFHCDQLNMLWTRALQIFIEFRIQSKYWYQMAARTPSYYLSYLAYHQWDHVAFTWEQFPRQYQDTNRSNVFQIYTFKITPASPRGQWVNIIGIFILKKTILWWFYDLSFLLSEDSHT